MTDEDPQPPLPEPEYFERREIMAIRVDEIEFSLTEDLRYVVISLTEPRTGFCLAYPTTPAGARQLAAFLLNKADDVDEAQK